jgi:hypothetical protein
MLLVLWLIQNDGYLTSDIVELLLIPSYGGSVLSEDVVELLLVLFGFDRLSEVVAFLI